MLQLAFQRYINNFRGFSREIWILAIITFINRAGTMVLPFLSKYLKEDLHFTYGEVGWIMVCFGFGSILGSWLGGKLSDKIGFYRIMIISLLVSGLLFFVIQFITSFIGLCISMFLIMTVEPGFGGQKFIASQLAKIRTLRAAIDASGRRIDLEVDGGINVATAL